MLRSSIAVLVLLFFSCARATTPQASERKVASSYQRAIVDRSAVVASKLAETPILEAPAVVQAIYRVRPDRRFVNAAADIVEINTGRRIEEVETAFVDGGWEVRVSDAKAFTLAEIPTFGDALSALSQWASKQSIPSGHVDDAVIRGVDDDIAHFYPRFLFAALHKLEATKQLDAAASARAARAATLLATQTYDTFDLADPLRGRAMALLAIAKSRDGHCCSDTEALLASIMGYANEAHRIAKELPAGFVRARVTGEDVNATQGAAEAWLSLARRFNKESLLGNEKPLTVTIDVEGAPPVILENMALGNGWAFGIVAQSLLLRSMTHPKNTSFTFDDEGKWQSKLGDLKAFVLLAEYDEKLPAFARSRATGLVDARDVMSYYDANFYAALHQQFEVFYGHLGDVPGATNFAASLKPATAIGKNVADWMSNLVDAEYGRFSGARVAPALAAVSLLGGGVRYELFEAIQQALSVAWEVHAAARDMFATLDSRPDETLHAGQLADYPIGDLARRDQYIHAALDRNDAGYAGRRARYLSLIGDRDALQKLADDGNAANWDRISALCSMSGFSDDDLHVQWESLIAKDNYNTAYLDCYWDYLNRRKQPALKARFAEMVLRHRPNLDPIPRAYVVSALGNGLEAQGRYEEAWRWVEPEVPVFQANIVSTATSLLQRLGRNADSIKLGRQLVERYPDAFARSDFACVLWRMGKYDDAAQMFNPAANAYSLVLAGDKLPQAMLATFDEQHIGNAIAAYDTLIKAHVAPSLLSYFGGAALHDKRWALAFALDERYLAMPTHGADRNVQLRSYANSYHALKEMKGEDAAMSWFVTHVPSGDLNVLIELFMNGELDLLTRFVTAHPPTTKQLESASILASALTIERVPLTDSRWNTVRSLTPATVAAEDRTIQMSVRYLLREADAAQVAQTIATPNSRSEGAYFLGIRAAGDGDFDRALGYFLVAGEGPAGYAPTSWSISRLYTWRGKQQTWRDITAKRML